MPRAGFEPGRVFGPDLARGIAWALDPARQPALRAQCRAKAVATFSAPEVARQHLALYAELRDGAAGAS